MDLSKVKKKGAKAPFLWCLMRDQLQEFEKVWEFYGAYVAEREGLFKGWEKGYCELRYAVYNMRSVTPAAAPNTVDSMILSILALYSVSGTITPLLLNSYSE